MTCIEPGELVIPLHELAKTLGWHTETAVRAFCRCNWAFQVGGSGRWYCLESQVATAMPQLYLQWRELKDAGAFKVPLRARKGNNNARRHSA